MKDEIARRDFLRISSAAVAGSAMAGTALLSAGVKRTEAAEADAEPDAGRIQKCLKFGMVQDFQYQVKNLGSIHAA